MRCQTRTIPAEFLGQDYDNDPEFRARFQAWVSSLWEEKDALLAELHREYPPGR